MHTNVLPQEIPLVYADEHLLVANKPSGLLTVPGRGPDKQDCLINRLLVSHPNARIVHRLDQATSGMVIIALNYEAQRDLNKQFEQRLVKKRYLAVVDGLVEAEDGEIDLPLICDWPNRPRQMVDHENGKSALTLFEVLQRDTVKLQTRVQLKPITGRSHQLRVHMLALGHPILGDNLYAHESARTAVDRLQLHATYLHFQHPVTGKDLQLNCESSF